MPKPSRPTFTTADGRTFRVPKSWPGWDHLVGLDELGEPVGASASDPTFLFTLTPCCGASYKGMEPFIGCRRCYREVEPTGGGMPTGAVSRFVHAEGETT